MIGGTQHMHVASLCVCVDMVSSSIGRPLLVGALILFRLLVFLGTKYFPLKVTVSDILINIMH